MLCFARIAIFFEISKVFPGLSRIMGLMFRMSSALIAFSALFFRVVRRNHNRG